MLYGANLKTAELADGLENAGLKYKNENSAKTKGGTQQKTNQENAHLYAKLYSTDGRFGDLPSDDYQESVSRPGPQTGKQIQNCRKGYYHLSKQCENNAAKHIGGIGNAGEYGKEHIGKNRDEKRVEYHAAAKLTLAKYVYGNDDGAYEQGSRTEAQTGNIGHAK